LFLLKTCKALNGILCADVPLRNYVLHILISVLLLCNAGKLAANSEGAETLHDVCQRYVETCWIIWSSCIWSR